MTESEKLIALLDDFPVQMEWHDTSELADYLIANGVTVRPTFVGETVYGFWDVSEYETRAKNKRKRNVQITSNHQMDWVRKYGTIEIRPKQCTKTDMLVFGKFVFRTHEDAENALAQWRADHGRQVPL